MHACMVLMFVAGRSWLWAVIQILFSDNSQVDHFVDYYYSSQELFNYNTGSLIPFISYPQENLYSLVPEIFPRIQEYYYEQPKIVPL